MLDNLDIVVYTAPFHQGHTRPEPGLPVIFFISIGKYAPLKEGRRDAVPVLQVHPGAQNKSQLHMMTLEPVIPRQMP